MPHDSVQRARFVKPGEREKIIGIDTYVPEHHKGWLRCIYCNAAMHFNGGSPASKGSNARGTRAHFHTNPGQTDVHKKGECPIYRKITDKENNSGKPEYDKNKGFRVHLNISAPDAKGNLSDLYITSASGRIFPVDKVADMESISITCASDFENFLVNEEQSRIAKSIVIYKDVCIPIHQFFLSSQANEEDVHNLVNYMIGRKEPTPVMLKVTPAKPPVSCKSGGKRDAYLQIPCEPIRFAKNNILYPDVHIENTQEMREAGFSDKELWKNKTPLVLCFPSLTSEKKGQKQHHYMRIHVMNPSFVKMTKWDNIEPARKEMNIIKDNICYSH